METPGVLAIVRLRDHRPPDALFEALVEGGVDAVEVTLQTPGSLDCVRRWAERAELPVGVGTVRTRTEALSAVAAGAQFVVTPTTVPEVVDCALDRSVPVVCGALTPTEIDSAWLHGASAVKVFPASTAGGPAYLRAVREPLHDVPLLPTGGVAVDSARAYARVGCVGIGVGGALLSDPAVAEQRWSDITETARQLAAAWAAGMADRHG